MSEQHVAMGVWCDLYGDREGGAHPEGDRDVGVAVSVVWDRDPRVAQPMDHAVKCLLFHPSPNRRPLASIPAANTQPLTAQRQ